MTPTDTEFTVAFNRIQQVAFQNACLDGRRDTVSDPEKALLLIIREVSQVTDAIRRRNLEQDHLIPGFLEVEAELADIVLRCMAFARANGYDLAGAIEAKADYDAAQPPKTERKKF